MSRGTKIVVESHLTRTKIVVESHLTHWANPFKMVKTKAEWLTSKWLSEADGLENFWPALVKAILLHYSQRLPLPSLEK